MPARKSALDTARELFARGDMVAARRDLERRAADTSTSESDRKDAAELRDATRIDRGALAVGFACVVLLLLVVVVTALRQPA